MRSILKNAVLKTAVIAGALLTAGVSSAADVYLQARAFDKQLPDGAGGFIAVRMWGFADCGADDTFAACTDAAPGPQINVTTADTLNIHVNNTLGVPVSIVIPGQPGAGDPVPMSTAGRPRVQSFTSEAAAGTTTTFTFTGLRQGSYLYQSGTNPSLQVPMGLYGALVVTDGATSEAYPGLLPAADTVLLFSEVDPIQNQRVDNAATAVPGPACVPLADFAANMTAGYPCTIDYSPAFFLVNGEPTLADLPGGDGTGAQNVLLRLLNAGLRPHTPTIVGTDLGLVAEDGNPYPGLRRQQSTVLLAPGKTLDVLIAPASGDATLSLFDRMPTFSNENLPNGGSLATIQVGAGATIIDPGTGLAGDDAYDVTEDTALSIASPGVLTNDAGLAGATLVGSPANGTLAFNDAGDGSFTYTPNADFSGYDSFTYSAGDGTNTYVARVALNVSFENDAPVAADDGPYVNTMGADIAVAAPGILGNDADADGDVLTVAIEGAAPAGLALNTDGSFAFTGGVPGAPVTFQYTASDGTSTSAPATVTLNFNPVSNIALNVVDPKNNNTPVTAFRWTVEEDTHWQPDPSINPPPTDTLATNFHRSYMPVIAQGSGAAEFAQLALDPAKHYYVSVLPADAHDGAGHTIGGARILPGQASVTVDVNPQPIPYAQLSIFVFDDSAPTNGAVDGGEVGLGGFQVTIEDAGGRYGVSAGTLSQDADGNPLTNALDCFGGAPPKPGLIVSCPDTPENRAAGIVGEILIKNLFPGKYGVITAPPLSQAANWVQTSTIEGTKVIDAWVKAGEPPFFQEFGPAGWHVFVGFVNPGALVNANPGNLPTGTVSGRVTNMHMSRPPNQTLWDSTTNDALAHTTAWVGLNSDGGIGPTIAAVQASDTGDFTIPNVPDGVYQLVVWDKYLDQVIAFRGVTISNGIGGDIGTVPVFQWFARFENTVFLDDGCGDDTLAGNGIRDAECEMGLPEQAVNVRWRDGTVNQSAPTDTEGFVPFDELFPFFHWLVAEVDYTRFKATGVTMQVDGGGDVTSTGFVLNPQVQADGALTRTETGPVLTQGIQVFLGQTNVFEWGKMPYAVGENGGISGIVYYASTRAENDPRYGAAEPWEPGVPRVKMRLYREVQRADGTTGLALVQEAETDSWDDSLPTECPGADPTDAQIVGTIDKCYDGLRNFNQARPAVFDGGYAFNDIPPGKYVVEAVPPAGYQIVKEEDVNVGFGDTYGVAPVAVVAPGGALLLAIPDAAMVVAAQQAEPGLAQPPCVGAEREVPAVLSLFPEALVEAPFAGALRPTCDRKEVILSDQGQAAADFYLFTQAPISSHFVGMILDDTAQEFNPLSPQFGEKWAPPFVPVSVRDFNGKEISRTYSDQWGRMNALVPSTFTANMPSPSGYSPAMHMTCMNDPGPIPDPANPANLITDPQYNPAYSNFCYTFQYMPGTTTYLDTPVLPASAFASGYNPPDCAAEDGAPVIRQVSSGTSTGPVVARGGTLTIQSQGTTTVPNPAYEGPGATGLAGEKTITRNYGFGTTPGVVTLNGAALAAANVSWSDAAIAWTVPSTYATGIYQLGVTTADGRKSTETITVEVRAANYGRIRVPADQPTIQAAIDAASPGDLIMVAPGSYDEMVIMWKPVRLQGAGAGVTFINGAKRPTHALVDWRAKMDCLFGIGNGCTQRVSALPNQLPGAAGFDTEEGAAITVVGIFDDGQGGNRPANSFQAGTPARIDGFSITGGDTGGGIFVNGNAHRLQIANNRVFGNSGSYHGGIRIGRPYLELDADGPYAFNVNVNVHHNAITQNGGLDGAGGGVSIMNGTDRYTVQSNFICGNFTQGDGGGIGHLGRSDNGVIADNRILFNQTFMQGVTVSGGGVFIGGEPPLVGEVSQGAGSVIVDRNLIQGNQAASGHGGGLRTQFVNGRDVIYTANNQGNPRPGQWNTIRVENNVIVDNLAGWAGGGISLQDTARSFINNNTVAHNDSTATVAGAFTNADPNLSAKQPAGISSELHSTALTAAIPETNGQNGTANLRLFSNPTMANNIVWQNRSFHYDATGGSAALVPELSQAVVGECVAGANYEDLGVLGGAHVLSPMYSVLTDTTGYDASNTSGDPALIAPRCNGGRTLASTPGAMFALPALDEGGATWVDVRFGPLVPGGDYHIGTGSSGLDNGTSAAMPNHDFDNQARPQGAGFDRGADEVVPAN